MIIPRGSEAVLSKWFIVNATWFALLGAAWHQGWISYIFEKDITYISHGIALVTILMLVMSFFKAMGLRKLFSDANNLQNRYKEAINRPGADRSDVREALGIELAGNISIVDHIATTALAVGVLGTVIGLIYGFWFVDPNAISNVNSAGSTVAGLLKGLSVAFHTTLVGGIANLWLRMNHYLLLQGSSYLYTRVLGA